MHYKKLNQDISCFNHIYSRKYSKILFITHIYIYLDIKYYIHITHLASRTMNIPFIYILLLLRALS
jgi:hypothetical protein